MGKNKDKYNKETRGQTGAKKFNRGGSNFNNNKPANVIDKKNAAGGGKNKKGKGKMVSQKKLDKQKNPSLKNKIRGLRRLMSQPGLSEDAKKEKMAELDVLQAEFAKKKQELKEKHYSKRYHMVKFFERKKVARRMEKVTELLKDESLTQEKKDEFLAEMEQLKLNLDYTMFYPRDQKYISLFKKSDPRQIATVRKLVAEQKAKEMQEAEEALKNQKEMQTLEPADGPQKRSLEEQDDFFMDSRKKKKNTQVVMEEPRFGVSSSSSDDDSDKEDDSDSDSSEEEAPPPPKSKSKSKSKSDKKKQVSSSDSSNSSSSEEEKPAKKKSSSKDKHSSKK